MSRRKRRARRRDRGRRLGGRQIVLDAAEEVLEANPDASEEQVKALTIAKLETDFGDRPFLQLLIKLFLELLPLLMGGKL